MKRQICGIAGIMMGLAVAGCSSLTVSSSYDPEVDFSRMTSFAWLGTQKIARDDLLTVKNIRHAVKHRLEGAGIVENLQTPAFLVAIHTGREKKVDVQRWGYAYADRPYYGHLYGRGYRANPLPARINYQTGTHTFEYEIGTLILDFVDPADNQLIWRGTATAVVEDQVSREKIEQAVERLLADFPPPTKR